MFAEMRMNGERPRFEILCFTASVNLLFWTSPWLFDLPIWGYFFFSCIKGTKACRILVAST